MFEHYAFIDEGHRIALEASLRGRLGVTQQQLVKLYKHAHEAATTGSTSRENGYFHSRIETGSFTVGACTDAKTGVYVQLAKHTSSPHLLLTLGQKYAMENVDTMRGNTNIQFWLPS